MSRKQNKTFNAAATPPQPVAESLPVSADAPQATAATESQQTYRLPQLSHAGECVMCPEFRKQLGRKNDTGIYSTKGPIRYCKCYVCGHTWKFSDSGSAT